MQGQTNRRISQSGLQRALRNSMTDAERALWRRLKGRQLAGFKFRRQHPYRDFILDFVCLEKKLVIEVDGGQHANSTSDTRRDVCLNNAGFRVLRFWNHEVLNEGDAVAEAIYQALTATQPHHPHPGPPLEGEGE